MLITQKCLMIINQKCLILITQKCLMLLIQKYLMLITQKCLMLITQKCLMLITQKCLILITQKCLIIFRMEGRQKGPFYQFFPCSFYKRKNQPQNFMTFSFNPFVKLVQKAIPSANPNFLNLKQDHPAKNMVF